MERCRRTGKLRHKTKLDAQLALVHSQRPRKNRKRANKREEVRFYHCSFCGGWHLTSAPRDRREDDE